MGWDDGDGSYHYSGISVRLYGWYPPKKGTGQRDESAAILVAIGVNSDESHEDKNSWTCVLQSLKNHGLHSTRLIIGDRCFDLMEVIHEVFSGTLYLRCMVHFMRNIHYDAPHFQGKEVGSCSGYFFPEGHGCLPLKSCVFSD
ncbi:MAG: transposase [Clostridia bacterium]|nr:transposase [Clostridia bacterium]